MERRDLYQDDLTEERQPTPAERDDVARSETLDPDVLDTGVERIDDVDDDEDDEDDDPEFVEDELDD